MITIEPPSSINLPASGVSKAVLARFLLRAKKAVGLDGEVHVLLADDVTLRRLNRTFRRKDEPTDVLSFPAGPSTVFFGEPEGPGLAGDLAISLETALRHANQFAHTLKQEVCILMLHGLLHLAGYDHEVDSGEMAARETQLRHELKLPVGLIARTAATPPAAAARRRQRA